MRGLGWVVAGTATGLAVSAAAAVLAANREARARFAVSARQGRDWAVGTGERWSAGATLARDRVAGTTEDLRGRWVGGAEEWRDRRTEEMGRRLLSAAEARDARLEDDDADEDESDADEDESEEPGR